MLLQLHIPARGFGIKGIYTFSQCIIMARLRNLPDLRSPKWEFRDASFAGIDTLNSRKFRADSLRTVA